MSELFAIKFDKEKQAVRVSGELTLESAKDVLAEMETLFDSPAKLDIDLTDVTRADSASLALLITWMRQAKKSGKAINFRNLPKQMHAIARASGLDEILPIQ
ncbi:STAS domain-containing protein [Methylophaga sp.]|uniref:STAS domain-containing protein n=1 Tax=Methylophaga sp. TaxID=2024840 RepID=UPI003F697D36